LCDTNGCHREAGVFKTSEDFLASPYLTSPPYAWSRSATDWKCHTIVAITVSIQMLSVALNEILVC